MNDTTALRSLIENRTYRISSPLADARCPCGRRGAVRVDGSPLCQDCWPTHPASKLVPLPAHACLLDKDTMLTHVECWHDDIEGVDAFYDGLLNLPDSTVIDALVLQLSDGWWRDFHQVCEAASLALAREHNIPIPADVDS